MRGPGLGGTVTTPPFHPKNLQPLPPPRNAQLRPLSSPEAGTQAQDPAPTSPRNTGAPRRRAGMGSRLWALLTGQKRPREEEQEEQEEGQGQ